MHAEKTKDFSEYLLENVQAAREETREFKKDINKRMDDLNKRMDRIETRMDKRDKLLTSAFVSAFVTTICWILIHWRG